LLQLGRFGIPSLTGHLPALNLTRCRVAGCGWRWLAPPATATRDPLFGNPHVLRVLLQLRFGRMRFGIAGELDPHAKYHPFVRSSALDIDVREATLDQLGRKRFSGLLIACREKLGIGGRSARAAGD